MKEMGKKLGLPILAVVLVSVFPAIFLYCQNAEEAGFGEILPVIGGCIVAGLVLFALLLAITRSANQAGVIASIFAGIIMNFSLLEKAVRWLFSSLRYWHVVPIVLVVGLHIGFLVFKFIPRDISTDIVKVVCLVFGALIVINCGMSVPGVLSYQRAKSELSKSQANSEKVLPEGEEGKPNIYLFIFDEYANFPQLQEYYNYDNEPLMSFLTENNFSVSYTSHNESYMTPTVLTNLMNLEYLVTDETDTNERQVLRQQGKLFSLMEEQGYAVDILESFNFMGGHLPEGDTASEDAATMDGATLVDLFMQQTIVYPFWETNHPALIDNALKVVEYMSEPDSLPESDTFTLVYLDLPHAPFVVDEEGNAIPVTQSVNWVDKQYYLGQLKFTTKMMLQMLQNIVDNDPHSVIILQSDHGGRGGAQEGFRIMFPYEVKTNPLNAVYIYGTEQLDIEGLSSVNTLRTLLNYLWRTDYEMLPVPENQKEEIVE